MPGHQQEVHRQHGAGHQGALRELQVSISRLGHDLLSCAVTQQCGAQIKRQSPPWSQVSAAGMPDPASAALLSPPPAQPAEQVTAVQASSREADLQQMQQYSQRLGSNLSGLEDRLKADRSKQASQSEPRAC